MRMRGTGTRAARRRYLRRMKPKYPPHENPRLDLNIDNNKPKLTREEIGQRRELREKYRGPRVRRGRNRTSPQSEAFFESREWLELRYNILKRDGAICALCGITRADGAVLQVDHIEPRSKFPERALDPGNLQVLCRDCIQGKSNKERTAWRPKGVPSSITPIRAHRADAESAPTQPSESKSTGPYPRVASLSRS